MNKSNKDVFISYSRKDIKEVKKFCDLLSKANISYWFDTEGIENGTDFKTIIVDAIEKSTLFLFFSSANSNQSQWTAKEIGIAVERHKHIIPIKLDDSKYAKAVEFDLINLDFVDFSHKFSREKSINKLITTIQSKTGKPTDESVLIAISPKYRALKIISLAAVIAAALFTLSKCKELTPIQKENKEKLGLVDSLLTEQQHKLFYNTDGAYCYDSIDHTDLITIKKTYEEIDKSQLLPSDTLIHTQLSNNISSLIDSIYHSYRRTYEEYSNYEVKIKATEYQKKMLELEDYITVNPKNYEKKN